MGTRSLTKVIEVYNDQGSGKTVKTTVACMYRQMDGYPTGHGVDLAKFLSSGKLVNGIGMEDTRIFNGAGCLAAQMVADFKDGAGNIYLTNTNRKVNWEDYEYLVYCDFHTHEMRLVCREIGGYHSKKLDKWVNKGKVIFDGTPQEFLTSKLVID